MESVLDAICRFWVRSRFILLLCAVVVLALGSWFARSQAGFPSRDQQLARAGEEVPSTIPPLDPSVSRQDDASEANPGEIRLLAASVPQAVARVEGNPV